MNFFTKLRIELGTKIKENIKSISIFILIFLAVFLFNQIYIKSLKHNRIVFNYKKNLLLSKQNVNNKVHNETEKKVSKFVEYCNKKEFQKAYNLISEDCKKYFGNYDEFLKYITNIFNEQKRYDLRAYSKKGNKYIYQIRYFENILATGLTKSKLNYIDSKLAITENKNDVELSIGGFIESIKTNDIFENDDMRVEVSEIITLYNTEIYEMNIINKTDEYLVVQDGVEKNELGILLGNEFRNDIRKNKVVLAPFTNKKIYLECKKFADDNREINKIEFNTVRFVKNYQDYTKEELLNHNAGIENKNIPTKKYSISVPIRNK